MSSLVLFAFLFVPFESYCQEYEFKFIPLHFDASFDRYPTDLDGKILIPSEIATDSILLFVKTKIPDLMLTSDVENGVAKIKRCADKGLRVSLKPGLHKLHLTANGFNDTTLTPKFFSNGGFYSLTASCKLAKKDYGVINLISKPDSCEIEIEDKLIPFRSPLMMQLKKNEYYKIRFTNPIYKCRQIEKSINFNESYKQVNFDLSSINGFLTISCTPKDSINANIVIFKNGIAIFDSTTNQTEVIKMDTGGYQINIKKAGFLEQERFIQIRPCDTLKFTVKMLKESAKIKKMMVNVTGKSSIFKLSKSEIVRLEDLITKHYQQKERIYVVPKKQANQVYEKLKASGDTLKVLSESRIDILLNCEAFILFEKPEEIGASGVEIDLGAFIVKNGIKKQYIQIIDKLNNYFPKRIDKALSLFDNFINVNYKSSCFAFIISEKGLGILGTAIAGGSLIYDLIWNWQNRKPLPPAPNFPNGQIKNNR
jgi:hypothetical protein